MKFEDNGFECVYKCFKNIMYAEESWYENVN